jgi:uncharacterized repeat protein (TIGR03803 family)
VAYLPSSGLLTAKGIGSATVSVFVAGSPNPQGSMNVTVKVGSMTETILHSFYGAPVSDGDHPTSLMQASDGNFYGLADNVVFKITPDGVETIPWDVALPPAVIQAKDGNFYGTTAGGANGAGAFVKITPDGVETVLYSFGASPSDGAQPNRAVIQASDGNFYGTTISGGDNYCPNILGDSHNCGTVFKITPEGVETILHSFGASRSDGDQPDAGVLEASDGNFYGTTDDGGANTCLGIGIDVEVTNNCGTVFKVTPDGVETVFYSFGASLADGQTPVGNVIQASDGNLWGTTSAGGGLPCADPNSCGGTVFRITLSGEETIVYRFPSTPADLGDVSGVFFQGIDGNFYGTTLTAGPYENPGGIVYQLTPDGIETTLYSFDSMGSDGVRPVFLMQARDGTLYGTTDSGGGQQTLNGQLLMAAGTVFKLTP